MVHCACAWCMQDKRQEPCSPSSQESRGHRRPEVTGHRIVYDQLALPTCWCGATHDCYADHEFSCSENNKIPAHHFFRDWAADTLKPVLATAGYIADSAKLDTERCGLISSDVSAFALWMSLSMWCLSPTHSHPQFARLMSLVAMSHSPAPSHLPPFLILPMLNSS